MNEQLRELYQEVILDHGRAPRNHHALSSPTHCQLGHNPLCGDELKLYLQCDAERITNIAFEGHGCAISLASASLMTEALTGKTLVQAEELFSQFHQLLTTGIQTNSTKLRKLSVFAGVREFPMRVKCATLAWHTLHAALKGGCIPVTTE